MNFKSHLPPILALSTAFTLLLTSCEETYISAHTDYLSHENLASYVIKTPDPLLNNPPVGQRLIVGWSVPRSYLDLDNLHLVVTIRFRNRTETIENLDILRRKGTFIYPVMDQDYFTTRGILTYKIDLMCGEQVLEEWRHQIWTELINVEREEVDLSGQTEQVEALPFSPQETPSANFYDDFE